MTLALEPRDAALLERIFEMRREQPRCTLTRSGTWRRTREVDP